VVPVAPTPDVAVIEANGNRQAVGVGQYFKAGDLWFQLLAVAPKTMKLAVVGGGFEGGKSSITIPLDDPITLVNTATGVEYGLRFTEAAAGIPTTSVADPTADASTPASPASSGTPPADGATPTTDTPAATAATPASAPAPTTTTATGA
jgi:hypothetical protein